MTCRLLLIGNSHLAALKSAHGAEPARWKALEPVWAGFLKRSLTEITPTPDALIPSGDEGARALSTFGHGDALSLDGIDAVAIVGCQVSMLNAVRLHRQTRCVALPSLADTPNLATMEPLLMSRAAWEETAKHSMLEKIGMEFAARLRAVRPDLEIASVPQPHITQGALRSTTKKLHGFRLMAEAGDLPLMARAFTRAVDGACDALDLLHLPQPRETIFRHAMTRKPYMRGSVRLAGGGRHAHPEDDMLHANAAYGALVLDQLEAAFAS